MAVCLPSVEHLVRPSCLQKVWNTDFEFAKPAGAAGSIFESATAETEPFTRDRGGDLRVLIVAFRSADPPIPHRSKPVTVAKMEALGPRGDWSASCPVMLIRSWRRHRLAFIKNCRG